LSNTIAFGQIREKYPHLASNDVTKALGMAWRALPPGGRDKYDKVSPVLDSFLTILSSYRMRECADGGRGAPAHG
jgi:hypothetical protein